MNQRRNRIRIAAGILTLSMAWPVAVGRTQTGPPAEVRQAQALFQARDYAGAIKTLEEFFRRNPSATLGWLLLGNCYREQGELDKALAAYARAAEFRLTQTQAWLNAAAIHARRDNRDEAFKLLGKLRWTGSYDMDLIRDNVAFAGLREDSRFAGLFPKPEDFARPFVETARVLHEWTSETKGDQFGWIARGIGDVDGDGIKEVATSAPTYGANGQPSGPGRVYVYSGKTGKLLWTRTGQPGEGLGMGLEKAGDVNRDGIPDVIAGAPGGNHAYVFSGRDGTPLLSLAAREGDGSFGRSVSGVGDQNGDGYADIIVGAPGNQAGRAYVFSGKDGAVLFTLTGEQAGDGFGSIVAGSKDKQRAFLIVGAPGAGASHGGRVYVYAGLRQTPSFVIESDETGSRLGGMFASVVGDVNGDGVPDIYASDWSNNAKGLSTGRVYVHSGADGRRLYTFTGEAAGDGFGIGSADVGDVNRDGYADLLIGAWQQAGAAPAGGKVYLYSGKDGRLLRQITCRIPGDTFGFDATGVGDIDGDGVVDFLVTSAWSAIHGFQSGRMFVLSGKP